MSPTAAVAASSAPRARLMALQSAELGVGQCERAKEIAPEPFRASSPALQGTSWCRSSRRPPRPRHGLQAPHERVGIRARWWRSPCPRGSAPSRDSRSAPDRRSRPSARPPRAASMIAAIALSTAGFRSSNSGATSSESRSTPSDELREVVGADREAVEQRGELVGQDRVGRNLRHHVDLEPALAAREAVGGQQLEDPPALAGRAAERDHQLHVREPHLARAPGAGPGTRARRRPGSAGARSGTRRGTRASDCLPRARSRARRRARRTRST